MTLNEKIKGLIKERGWKLKDLEKAIKQVFGDNGVTYFTLSRLGKGKSRYRMRTLHQICSVLGITKKELLKDVEENAQDVRDKYVLKSDENYGRLCYSQDAYLEILTPENNPLKKARLTLLPGGKTKLTQGSPRRKTELYVIEGKLKAYIGSKKYEIHEDELLEFESSMPHQFENKGAHIARCLIDEYQNGVNGGEK